MTATDYPLIIKNLLLLPTRQPTQNQISYRDVSRYDYATLGRRIALVPRPGSVLETADLRAHVSQHVTRGEISKYAVPEVFVMVESLDRTSVGKVDKKALRQKYGSARAAT